MRAIIRLITAVLIISVCTYAFSDTIDSDLIENAVIINSLSLTSENNNDRIGEIDSDDILTEQIKNNSNYEIEKNKDNRWHLTRYRIKSGDSLWGITKKFNSTIELIVSVNNINQDAKIQSGKELLIPNRNGFLLYN